MKWGIVVFPGSNCDHDAYHVLKHVLKQDAEFVWHKEAHMDSYDVIVLPGGFSYGDYLRTGAMARFSPVMKEVIRFAKKGGYVLGICNGFQILLESGLLPGAMLRNQSLKFVCDSMGLTVENNDTPFTFKYSKQEAVHMPIAHMEGNYFIEDDGLKQLQDKNQIVFRYRENPNGSLDNIAGICNSTRNVLGLMPHPERVSEELLGSEDGKRLFQSVIESLS